MAEETDNIAAREQVERRRLARLIDALPVFSGFITLDGHVSQARPHTDEVFLWTLPLFAYSHPSISQVVDACDLAAKGERVQIERPYFKSRQDEADTFGRGLLTLSPVFNDRNDVGEIAVTLIDCDQAGLIPRDDYAKSRLAQANARIDTMLNLASIIVETSQSIETQSSQPAESRRDALARRLDTLATAIAIISDLDRNDYPLDAVITAAMDIVPGLLANQRLQRPIENEHIPITLVPLMILLLSELITNAQQHGAWQSRKAGQSGSVSIQSDLLDTAQGRVLRLHWIEDGGPRTSPILYTGFGFTLSEQLFPKITGGSAARTLSTDGLSWAFDLPLFGNENAADLEGANP